MHLFCYELIPLTSPAGGSVDSPLGPLGLNSSKMHQLSPPSPRRMGIDIERERSRELERMRIEKERDRSRERDRDYHPDMDRIRDRDRDRHKRHHGDHISPKRKKQPRLKPDLKLKCGACGKVCFSIFSKVFIVLRTLQSQPQIH